MKKMLVVAVSMLSFIGGEVLSMRHLDTNVDQTQVGDGVEVWNERIDRVKLSADSVPLGSIVVLGNIKILGSGCFSFCESLTEVFFDSGCFSFCKSLAEVLFNVGSRLTHIESNAFSSSSLEWIVIPRSVKSLGSECFSDCKRLTEISFEVDSRLTHIGSNAFVGSPLESLESQKSIVFSRDFKTFCFGYFYNRKSPDDVLFTPGSRFSAIMTKERGLEFMEITD
jgi:hypothetical protein